MRLKRLERASLLGLLLSVYSACGEPPAGEGTSSVDVEGQAQALSAPAWTAGTQYKPGDLVSDGSTVYRCVQGHTAQIGWEPHNVPALWDYEGEVTTGTPPSTSPNGRLTFDYVTLEADCDADPAGCCEEGSKLRELTSRADTFYSTQPNECVLGKQGRDTIFLQSGGPSSLNLGVGDDVAMDGASDDLIWGGVGNDTINGWGGTNLFFGGYGNDIINAANGKNTVVPGPGADVVALGTGDDVVHIFDVCELAPGEKIDGGTGYDVLYAPVSEAELIARGVTITNFDRVIVQPEPCRSQCGNHAGCNTCSIDTDRDGTPDCRDECRVDPYKTRAGICSCGQSDVDTDGDKVPNCFDECPKDRSSTRAGDCGCPSDPEAAGTLCGDAVCNDTNTCDGAGHCGNDAVCAPEPKGCTLQEFRDRFYWFCNGVTRDSNAAKARCEVVPGRTLARIDSRIENEFFASMLAGQRGWLGAGDAAKEGDYRWSQALFGDTLFWRNGARYGDNYANWSGGRPLGGEALDCVALDGATGLWTEESCTQNLAYVCEQPGSSLRLGVPGDPEPEPLPPLWRAGPGCVQPGTEFSVDGKVLDEAAMKALVEDCTTRCPTGKEAACAEACVGPASIPAETARCNGFGAELTPEQRDALLHGCVLENVDLSGTCESDSECEAHEICAMHYDCTVCDANGAGGYDCSEGCPGERRCGTANASCAKLLHERCGESEVCGVSRGIISGNPVTDPGSNLTTSTVTPETLLGAAATLPEQEFYPEDPACDAPPCERQRDAHPWCHFESVAELPHKGADDNDGDDKQANAGGSIVSFNVDPNLTIDFKATPKVFGESKIDVKAEASLLAQAEFELLGGRGTVKIIDALAGVYAERCRIHSDLRFNVFGINMLSAKFGAPEEKDLEFDTNPGMVSQKDCEDALTRLEKAADEAKKAMRDAEELIRQYRAAVDAGKHFDAEAFCNAVAKDPPPYFPAGDCEKDSPEQTINRFIRYYQRKVFGYRQGDLDLMAGLSDQLENMKRFQVRTPFEPPWPVKNEERWKVASAQFFLGPVPMVLQIESFVGYELKGGITASLTPTLPFDGNPSEFAAVRADIEPGATAGINLFVGAGFSLGFAEATAGVSGEVILGHITLPGKAGAIVEIAAAPDDRKLRADEDALSDGFYFPPEGPRTFNFKLKYVYGLSARLDQFLAGSLAAEVRLQFLFFSKRWRQELVRFNGLPTDGGYFFDEVLISGGGDIAALDGMAWGFARMPLPLVKLPELTVPGPMEPSRVDDDPDLVAKVSMTDVEELFYDSLCQCIPLGVECSRNDDCCDGDDTEDPSDDDTKITCFSDPNPESSSGGLNIAGPAICSECRKPDESCGKDSDCCPAQSGYTVSCEANACIHTPRPPR